MISDEEKVKILARADHDWNGPVHWTSGWKFDCYCRTATNRIAGIFLHRDGHSRVLGVDDETGVYLALTK